MSMSKVKEVYDQDQINDAFDKAVKEGTLTDVLGNPITELEEIVYEDFASPGRPLEINKVLPVVQHLQGMVLTIIDATFTDEKRIKYVKDLIKDAFSKQGNWLFDLSMRDFETKKKK